MSEPAWKLLSTPRAPGEDGYFEITRTELVDMLAAPPQHLVEFGCGAGATGAEVKRRFPHCLVEGFEYSATAAELAAKRLDRVHTGDVERVDFATLFAPASIDALLLADVLEHLYDPWALLVRIRPFLTRDAQVIASIPNIRNLALITALAAGTFAYEPAGLLDVTHIRFFTRREIVKMFAETGYEIVTMNGVRDARLTPYEGTAFPVNLETESVQFKNLSDADVSELYTIQFYVRARPGT
ncbi:MAG TPA: class I SAM-dependent methyltransferase [Gemmatimonadaceae bacterium]|nr:class I SAM-dependent methyltransferase [Gemmatimonadaceae bacterium]